MRHMLNRLTAIATLLVAASTADAQERRRQPAGADMPPALAGIPRDMKHPFAGVWRGMRTMPVGRDEISFRFDMIDDKYVGFTVAGGGKEAHHKLAATDKALVWEQPNSGGGTWVYTVKLAGTDSLVGTLVLRDTPPDFPEVPKGTLVLTRVAAR